MCRMRSWLMALPLILGLTGCGDIYYQTRYIPLSAESVYTGTEQAFWTGDREVYELPANPPAIDDLHRERVDCKRPGQSFKPQRIVGTYDPDQRYAGPGENTVVGGLDLGPTPSRAPAVMKKPPVAALGDDYGNGAREGVGVTPVWGVEHDPQPFRGSGTNLNPVRPVAAYRDDQTDWCPPKR
jgi:hypothetical protein